MARCRTYLALPALIVFAILAARGLASAGGGVINSPHNLSVSGGLGAHGIAYNEIRVCVFCHTPHNAVINTNSLAPLWNRALPEGKTTYTMYESDFFNQNVNPRPSLPTGSSRVCLSCHDGTLALNSYGGPILSGDHADSPTIMPSDVTPSKNSNLTTDLSDDHPISFAYTADLAARAQLVTPTALPPAVKLDKDGNLQCTACHDPHDNEFGHFLVMNNGDPTKPGYNPTVTSPLCVSCHAPSGWDSSSPHYAGAGCLNCHANHSSPVKEYLLSAPVGQVCFNGLGCHGSSGTPTHASPDVSSMVQLKVSPSGTSQPRAAQANRSQQGARSFSDLESIFSRSVYKHPVGMDSRPYKVSEQLPLRRSRVECVDCHNSHVAGSSSAMPGVIKKSLKKVKGINKDSLAAVEATSEYEICYKCHSGAFAFRFVGLDKPNRVIAEPDQMKRFFAANPSFHPVGANRRTGNGASLLAQYQNTMITITCTDCHNSDQSKKAGGTGPNGPHGSRYEHILIARYDMPLKGAAGRSSSCSGYRSDYALCFTCHSEDYVMTSGTFFANGGVNEHARHVVDRCLPCFACHDPHGVPVQDGASSVNNAHLINFDRGYASSQSIPVPRYQSNGPGSGSCTVSCHTGGTHSYTR
jgi:predicted CXXCH cytochrome family protein